MDFSRQEYLSGLPFPSPGNLPNPEIEPASPALVGRFFSTEPPGKPIHILNHVHKITKLKCLIKALIIHSILIILLACAFADTKVLFFELYHIVEFFPGYILLFSGGERERERESVCVCVCVCVKECVCVCVGVLPFILASGFEGATVWRCHHTPPKSKCA